MVHLNLPLVVVTCVRDLPMLFLQAESMEAHYNSWMPSTYSKTKLYIIINEPDTQLDIWRENFNHILPKYSRFDLTIIPRSQFDADWDQWIPSTKNPWATGWETQQILKLAIANYISEPGYFLLDSQNFLTGYWGTSMYPIVDGKLPYRSASFNMPMSVWDDYCHSLELPEIKPTDKTLNICTPLFFHTGLVKSLLGSKPTLNEFVKWFRGASSIKSEFTLYYLWGEKQGGFDQYHYEAPNWGELYLRDCSDFESKFNEFSQKLGHYSHKPWVCVNHRSWGDMTDDQYHTLISKLNQCHLFGDHFRSYRDTYVNIII